MNSKHYKRALLWTKEVISSLLAFWVKHPLETPLVLTFLYNKLFIFSRFLKRNVLIESQEIDFEKLIQNTQKLYNKEKSKFQFDNPKTYKNLESKISTRPQFLYFLVRKLKPKIIVETGVASGQSTGLILQALKDNGGDGKLYSIDLPFQWYIYKKGAKKELHLDSLSPGMTSGYLVPQNLRKNWKLILGDTYIELPKLLKSLPSVDFFIHDSEHTYKTMMFEYGEAWPKIKKNGYLLSDDVSFTDAFTDFAKSKKATKTVVFKNIGVLQK